MRPSDLATMPVSALMVEPRVTSPLTATLAMVESAWTVEVSAMPPMPMEALPMVRASTVEFIDMPPAESEPMPPPTVPERSVNKASTVEAAI